MATVVIWIGYAAGTLTTLAFFPQVLHVWKTKRAEDLHIGTLVGFTAGISLWLLYGILRREAPIIVANLVTLLLQGGIIFLKLRYARAGKRSAAKSGL
jgi:MtN3 and saliva related transmembrane protein